MGQVAVHRTGQVAGSTSHDKTGGREYITGPDRRWKSFHRTGQEEKIISQKDKTGQKADSSSQDRRVGRELNRTGQDRGHEAVHSRGQ